MFFITRSQIERYGRGFAANDQYVGLIQARAAALSASSAETTIFLSHSHKDRDLIEPAIAFLRSHGVSIYVDWQDGEMPPVISGETAKRIKEKIRMHQKFIVLVTEHSKDSRWVPWELGFADPVKGMEHIAILPVTEGTDFVKNEYMKIYPKIEHVNGKWKVWLDDPLRIRELPDWLHS
jgi:hypothetical protein